MGMYSGSSPHSSSNACISGWANVASARPTITLDTPSSKASSTMFSAQTNADPMAFTCSFRARGMHTMPSAGQP